MERTSRPVTYRVLATSLIENLKIYLVVKPLQWLCGSERLARQLEAMRVLPENTIGHDLAKTLDSHNLSLIPGFRNHDLHHLVLGYGIESEDELSMQAYLIGNGYYRWQCFVFLSSAIIIPALWPTLLRHFRRGRRCVAIDSLDIVQCLGERTAVVRAQFTRCKSDSRLRRIHANGKGTQVQALKIRFLAKSSSTQNGRF